MSIYNLFRRFFRSDPNPGKISQKLREEYDQTRVNGPHELVCYAPYRHLYFGHEGKVYSCCYSRDYLLGKYPDRSIREIWASRTVKKLRDKIANDDFLPACSYCLEQLRARNFSALQARPFDETPANSDGYPNTITFELDNTCNLECSMCSGKFSSMIRKKRENLPPIQSPYDEEFFNQIREFIPHLFEAKFLGGEPFLIKEYFKIWDLIAELSPGTRIFLQTNGTVLNSKIKELFTRVDFHIGISVDSLQPQRYEKIRKNASLELVLENLRYFRDYSVDRGTFFGISVCGLRENWDEMADFVHFCNENNAKLYINTVMHPEASSILGMQKDELGEIVRFYDQVQLPEENQLQRMNRQHFLDWLNQVRRWETEEESTRMAHLSMAKKMFMKL